MKDIPKAIGLTYRKTFETFQKFSIFWKFPMFEKAMFPT